MERDKRSDFGRADGHCERFEWIVMEPCRLEVHLVGGKRMADGCVCDSRSEVAHNGVLGFFFSLKIDVYFKVSATYPSFVTSAIANQRSLQRKFACVFFSFV